MLKALLVDMDGTLVQSADANAAAYAMALREYGIDTDATLLAPVIDGRSWRDFLPALTISQPEVSPEAVAQRKRELYPDFFHLIRLNESLRDLIRTVRGQLATALVTTASTQAVTAIIKEFELNNLFDVIVTGDDVTRPKPHPEGYACAATRLNVSPSECLLIEDSETGIQAARAFGGNLLRWCPAGLELRG